MTSMFQRWERGTRFYEAEACVDMFGTPCVVVTYGGIGTPLGRRYTQPCDGPRAVVTLLDAIARRRLARGYVPTRSLT